MRDFEYQSPSTIEETVGILAEHGDKASILAGGTDIIVQLREGMRKAEVVVDVKKIPQLTNIEWRDDGGLELGASVSCTRIAPTSAFSSAPARNISGNSQRGSAPLSRPTDSETHTLGPNSGRGLGSGREATSDNSSGTECLARNSRR